MSTVWELNEWRTRTGQVSLLAPKSWARWKATVLWGRASLTWGVCLDVRLCQKRRAVVLFFFRLLFFLLPALIRRGRGHRAKGKGGKREKKKRGRARRGAAHGLRLPVEVKEQLATMQNVTLQVPGYLAHLPSTYSRYFVLSSTRWVRAPSVSTRVPRYPSPAFLPMQPSAGDPIVCACPGQPAEKRAAVTSLLPCHSETERSWHHGAHDGCAHAMEISLFSCVCENECACARERATTP